MQGAEGALVDGDPRAADAGFWPEMYLYSRAYTIAGGSSEIMRNLISERGLPVELADRSARAHRADQRGRQGDEPRRVVGGEAEDRELARGRGVIRARDREHESRVGGALRRLEHERAAEVEQCELAVGRDQEVAGVGIRVDVAALQDELRSAKVDWQMIYYSGAVHAFTRPDAGNDNSKGAAYNERADKRSWEAMKGFFAEIFR